VNTVANTEFYTIEVDTTKNRVYFTLKGSWMDAQKLAAWESDVAAAFRLCSRGFTELIDWSDVQGIFLTDSIEKAQRLAMEAGISKAARVFPRETFAKMQMDTLTKKTSFPVKTFYDKSEAEAWLAKPGD
jgi:hypothetical protein